MRKRIMTVVLTASLAGAVFGLPPRAVAHNNPAEGCQADGPLKLVTISTPAATFYIDDRQFVQNSAGTRGGIWLYRESNDHEGLQRGGTTLTLGEAENCEDDLTDVPSGVPDTAIF